MTLKECYEAMEGDYEGTMGRMPSERLIQKYVLKFPADPSFESLKRAMEEKNAEEAFRAAHTIKGICANLGLSKLLASSSSLTELLRGGWSGEAEAQFSQVEADYRQTVEAIGQFSGSL